MTEPSIPRFDQYEAAMRARGFDEVLERRWPAAAVQDTHGHTFAVEALVVQGEMWLTVAGRTQHLRSGDVFTLQRDEAHAERYGEAGATYWAARRN